MNYSTTVAVGRLEQLRAAALDRENDLRRSIRDRGTQVTPARPAASPRRAFGFWFRFDGAARRISVSH